METKKRKLIDFQAILARGFAGAVLVILTAMLCWGGSERAKSPVFSITVSNERLDDVLDKVSKASGYKVTVNEGWRNKTVSARLENVTLEEGLKSIIEELGRPSHLLIYDETRKRVEIVMVSPPSSASESTLKVEPSAPYRGQRQVGPPSQARMPPGVRPPSTRRLRERPQRPTVIPEEIPERQERQDVPGEVKAEKKGPQDTETKVGEMPGESPDSPESEEVTPETKQESKPLPERRRRPSATSEEKPESVGP